MSLIIGKRNTWKADDTILTKNADSCSHQDQSSEFVTSSSDLPKSNQKIRCPKQNSSLLLFCCPSLPHPFFRKPSFLSMAETMLCIQIILPIFFSETRGRLNFPASSMDRWGLLMDATCRPGPYKSLH